MPNGTTHQHRALKTLILQPSAFTAHLTTTIPDGKVGWTTDDHWSLVQGLFPHLKDEKGNPASIPAALGNVLKLVYKPTEDAEKDVLRQAFSDAGYMLDGETENTMVMMFSAAQFADFLAKMNRPASSQTFIVKDKTKKRGAKKNMFASLLASPTPALSAPPPIVDSLPVEAGGDTDSGSAEADMQESTSGKDIEETTVEQTETAPKPAKKVTTTK